jgi:hypothetical protein
MVHLVYRSYFPSPAAGVLSIVIRFPLAILALPLAIASPVIALAQNAPLPKKAALPKAAPVQLVEGPKRAPLSDEGRAIQARIYGAPDPRMSQLNGDLAALRAERANLTRTPPVDLDQLEALLRREETILAEVRTRNNDRLMALLRALSEPDRQIMFENMNIPARKPVMPIPR